MTTKHNGQPRFATAERCDDKPRRAGQHGPIHPTEAQLKLAAAISLLLECGRQQAAWEALGATGESWTDEDAGIASTCVLMRLVASGADAARASLIMTIGRRRIEPDEVPSQDVIDQVNAARWAALMEFDARFPNIIRRGVK